MDSKELAKKEPMALPGFTVITPKEETEYNKRIQEEQEKQMVDCCGSGLRRQSYDQYGYKPRPQSPTQEAPVGPDSLSPPVSQNVTSSEKKNSKR